MRKKYTWLCLCFLPIAFLIFLHTTQAGRFFLLKHTQKVAIIYIATGNYSIFWNNFYQSAEKNFLPGVQRHYFLVSDKSFEKLPDNVTYIYYPHKEWPSIVVEKFAIIYSLKDRLADYSYTYSFNANTWFIQPVKGDILPSKIQKIIASLHPGFYKKNQQYPYCSDKNSPAYLEQNEKSKYYQSGVIGGITEDFIEMAKTIKQWTNNDLKRNYIPIWQDESYFNKYVSDKNPLVLTPDYIWGSLPTAQAVNLFAHKVKIVMLNKRKTNEIGIDYFRNSNFFNDKQKLPSNFFYVSYLNDEADFVLLDNGSFLINASHKSGKFMKKKDFYRFTYSTGEEKCFNLINKTSFLYEVSCPIKVYDNKYSKN